MPVEEHTESHEDNESEDEMIEGGGNKTNSEDKALTPFSEIPNEVLEVIFSLSYAFPGQSKDIQLLSQHCKKIYDSMVLHKWSPFWTAQRVTLSIWTTILFALREHEILANNASSS